MADVKPADKVDEAIEEFLFHLKRRVLFCDESGHMINWRSARQSDYATKAEYLADCGHNAYSESKRKVSIPLSALVSCQYSKDKFEAKEFFMRLVFEGHRNLDIKLMNQQDFEYCMDGFELVAKNRERFIKPPSFRPESMQEVWDADNYHPLVWEYSPGKTCNIGCGNDVEDILLISSCYGCLWSFLIAFYALLMKGTLDSDEKSTLLFMYLVYGVIYVLLVGLAVYTGQMEEDKKKKKRAALGLGEDEELPIDDDE
ncbi:hypothetical protein TrVE_jg9579 [Triparma verrucosa]|uniref:Uncharacterized protein n=1 Tax=Triparma verrucosa TaxID=1606542 RepID=A0A9W7EUK1_9STRA|nr:hypothetical protein TrVE_jg9579 [Triparma verrucosa]